MKTINKQLSTAVVLSAAAACAHASDNSETRSRADKGQVYVFESDGNGFNTKTVFYDNGAEVVAFDAQFTPALAEQAIAFLRQKTPNPISYLVVTHPNPDKFNGLDTFKRAGAKIVASESTAEAMPSVHAYKKYYFVNLAKMFTEETYPQLGQVDITFNGALDLELDSGEKIRLSELSGPGVSSTQTAALILSANALIVGDLIHHKAHAWLEGGIADGKPTPQLASWIKNLQELTQRYGRTNPMVYGGRGQPVSLEIAAPAQIAYLKAADKIVGDYVAALGVRKSEISGDAAGQHWMALQKAFEQAFPDYALSYMIQYGVYGLALTK